MDYRAARKCNEVNLLTAEESLGGSEQRKRLWKHTPEAVVISAASCLRLELFQCQMKLIRLERDICQSLTGADPPLIITLPHTFTVRLAGSSG